MTLQRLTGPTMEEKELRKTHVPFTWHMSFRAGDKKLELFYF
jgi:hypothetical protein